MGNSTLPQAGAAHEKNSRSTLSGLDKLPEDEREAAAKKRHQPTPEETGLASVGHRETPAANPPSPEKKP